MAAGTGSHGPRRSGVRVLAALVALALVLGLVAAVWIVGPGSPGPTPALDPTRPGFVPTPLSSVAPPTADCPAPVGFSDTSVWVGLARTAASGPVISFGLPLPAGALTDAGALRVLDGGEPVAVTAQVLLNAYDADGAPTGPRAVLVRLPASVLHGDCGAVEVLWGGGPGAASSTTQIDPAPLPYTTVSFASPDVVEVATRTIEMRDGGAALVETGRGQRILFSGRAPAVLATFPPGYLAVTGLFGHQVAGAQIPPTLAGLQIISEQVTPFGLSGMFQEAYALNPDAVVGPDDLDEPAGVTGYEAWLYDRCATFLLFAAHTGDPRFLREGYRSCSYYASKIALDGENRGIFRGKPEPDPKYSHLRGLYAYYALTGDETALAAGQAIAELWLNNTSFVAPYRAGHLRGPDDLWTERLLGTSLEGLYYGHLLTGDRRYLRAAQDLVATAHRHITGDVATLAAINPGATAFPPQDCFIHTAGQAAEGNDDQPWCSGWMPVLLVDPLLAYQDQTGDPRVDEIFIRLTRFLRDTGTAYFRGDLLDDDFLHPSAAYDPNEQDNPRLLVPLYGAGVDRDGQRRSYGEYDDFQHCLDATALTAAGLRALVRTGGYDRHPIAPFPSEGESFLALHHELASCAAVTFRDQTRLHRDPATFTADELAAGLADPKAFIAENRIGYPSHNVTPQRKLSWWFNTALAQFALLTEAGIEVPKLRPGAVQPGR